MKHSLSFLLILTLLFSCTNEENNDSPETKNDSASSNITRPEKSFDEENSETNNSDTVVKIQFENFTVIINRLMLWGNDKDALDQIIYEDSIFVTEDLSEHIEGQKIYILTTELEDFTIEQQYENSLVISNGDGHYDLTKWKHYNSEWKTLTSDSIGNFIAETYKRKEDENFPNINFEELKSYVKKEVREPWYSVIKNMNCIDNEKVLVAMSRIYLRIKGKNRTTGESVTKIIAIEIPLGC